MEELLLRSCLGAEELRSQELLHERKGRVQVKGGVGMGVGMDRAPAPPPTTTTQQYVTKGWVGKIEIEKKQRRKNT